MAKSHIIAGLDIGTSTIKFLVADKKSEEVDFEVLLLEEEPSVGVRRGTVIDIEKVSQAIQKILEGEKEKTGQRYQSVYVNVGGSHLFSTFSHGVVSVSRADQRISEEDIQRVLNAAQTFSLPSNKEIFDVFPREFIVDGQGGLKEALGLQGVRLEVEVLALGGFTPYLKNLSQAVLEADLQILDLIPSSLASARAVLSSRQKELGVALLDIGAGTANLAVFEEGDLIHLAVLPVGSSNITNDIAIGLKCDLEVAEKIKIEYGSCSPDKKGKREKIKIDEEEPLIFSQKQLGEIISARVSEIFSEVSKELKKIGKEKLLPAGIILTGGGAKLPKITELAKKEFKLPAKIGRPKGIFELDDPTLSTVCGLVLLGSEFEGEKGEISLGKGIGSKLKRIFRIFIP